MKCFAKILAIAITLLFAGTAIAGNTYNPGLDKQQRLQQKRIVQGIKSGELTRREVVRIECEQTRIARKERRFKADGFLTKRERVILQHDLNRSSRYIYAQKHNGQSRY